VRALLDRCLAYRCRAAFRGQLPDADGNPTSFTEFVQGPIFEKVGVVKTTSTTDVERENPAVARRLRTIVGEGVARAALATTTPTAFAAPNATTSTAAGALRPVTGSSSTGETATASPAHAATVTASVAASDRGIIGVTADMFWRMRQWATKHLDPTSERGFVNLWFLYRCCCFAVFWTRSSRTV
jgi:hypothetical protein